MRLWWKLYRLESQLARYSRVMVMSEIVRDISQYAEQAENWTTVFENRLQQSRDGPWFVHVLRTVQTEVAQAHLDNVNGTLGSGPVLAKYDELRAQIQKRFDQSVDNPRHFEKVQWFADYWNRSTPFGTANNQTVVGPGLGEIHWTVRSQEIPAGDG